jgi:hypothetical protein
MVLIFIAGEEKSRKSEQQLEVGKQSFHRYRENPNGEMQSRY